VRECALTLDYTKDCLLVGAFTETPGHTEEWAVASYACFMCSGHEGKCCEEPKLGAQFWCCGCCTVPFVSMRNQERVRLELRGGKQSWMVNPATGKEESDHCEPLCLAQCCSNYLGGLVSCWYAHLHGGARRALLRKRYKIKGHACGDCWDGGSPAAVWQEAFELGKRQGYEVPGTNTANSKAPASA
jgi:hypothetical protein